MIAGLCVAGCAFALGRGRWEVLVWVSAAIAPVVTLVLLAVLGFLGARPNVSSADTDPAIQLVKLAADMRAGHSLRTALAGVEGEGMDDVARLARAGRPTGEVLDAFVPRLGGVAPIARAALAVASSAGGSVSAALESLADQAVAMQDLARERRAALAPALIQAGVVGGIPLAVLAWMAASGRLLERLASGSVMAAVTIGGAVAIVVGVATIGWLVVRSAR